MAKQEAKDKTMRFMSESMKLFQCKECKLWYKEKEIAKKCEAWCEKYKSCNLEYLKYAVQPK